jgi:hypothetical protein
MFIYGIDELWTYLSTCLRLKLTLQVVHCLLDNLVVQSLSLVLQCEAQSIRLLALWKLITLILTWFLKLALLTLPSLWNSIYRVTSNYINWVTVDCCIRWLKDCSDCTEGIRYLIWSWLWNILVIINLIYLTLNSKAKTVTYRATLEGLTIQDIIEILALRGEELPEEVLRKIS